MQNTSLLATACPDERDDARTRSLPLLDRLLAHGWLHHPEPARPVVIGCDVFLATPLVRMGGGWRGVLIEWPGRPGIPPQEVRRAIHARVARTRRTVTLYTDASGGREVRAWCTPAGIAPSLYREDHRRRPGPGASEGPPEVARGPMRSGEAVRGARESAAAFIDFVGLSEPLPGGPRAAGSAASLIRWLGVEAEPGGVRRVWRGLWRFRVLDPAVGEGEWLLGAMEVLVVIGAACLDRMEGWVEDRIASAPGPRREQADFLRLLERRDELARDGGRDRLVHELVLLGCLRGLAARPAQARAVRRKLAARISSEQAPQVCTSGLVEVRAVRERAAHAPATGLLPGFRAQSAMLARAEALLRDLRLNGTGTLDELREGRRAVARMRSRLVRLAGEGGLDPNARSGLLGGGFHLVRGESAGLEDAAANA